MAKQCYIVVSEAFKNANEGTVKGCNLLATAITNDGKIVVNLNAVNEFTELFEHEEEFEFLFLTRDDFPHADN